MNFLYIHIYSQGDETEIRRHVCCIIVDGFSLPKETMNTKVLLTSVYLDQFQKLESTSYFEVHK